MRFCKLLRDTTPYLQLTEDPRRHWATHAPARWRREGSDMATTPAKKLSLFPLVSLLCFISIFFVLSFSRNASVPSLLLNRPREIFRPKSDSHVAGSDLNEDPAGSCDLSDGSWIYDPVTGSQRYDGSCKEIFKGWNCVLNNKSNALEIAKWRWKPKGCRLPPLDPLKFLQTYRDISIGILPLSLSLFPFIYNLKIVGVCMCV